MGAAPGAGIFGRSGAPGGIKDLASVGALALVFKIVAPLVAPRTRHGSLSRASPRAGSAGPERLDAGRGGRDASS